MIACAVALILLFDTSGSVSADRMELQQRGLAAALRSPEVSRQMRADFPVAMSVRSFAHDTVEVLAWRVLRSPADAFAMAEEVDALPVVAGWGATGLTNGIRSAIDAFEAVPCEAERRVLDVSADGEENTEDSEVPSEQRDRAFEAGIEINGLPILVQQHEEMRARRGELPLDTYFREHVVTPGGFVLAAADFADVSRALTRKMSLEIAGLTPWSEQAFLLQGASE